LVWFDCNRFDYYYLLLLLLLLLLLILLLLIIDFFFGHQWIFFFDETVSRSFPLTLRKINHNFYIYDHRYLSCCHAKIAQQAASSNKKQDPGLPRDDQKGENTAPYKTTHGQFQRQFLQTAHSMGGF
jgi:hypothetical protein